jgi:hypothetical protein
VSGFGRWLTAWVSSGYLLFLLPDRSAKILPKCRVVWKASHMVGENAENLRRT